MSRTISKEFIFLDMDGVLCDFCQSPMFQPSDPVQTNPSRMYEQFFFETLPPIAGAMWAARELLKMERVGNMEVHILSQPVKNTHYSYSEKASWIKRWIPELYGRITLTQNKEFLAGPGRYLIDDDHRNKWVNKWSNNGGHFIKFDYKRNNPHHCRRNWESIVQFFHSRYYDGPDNSVDIEELL